MPSFSDSLFLFVLALLLFGPKKLPVLARELGKWIGEFRRASNEFKFQMEEELRQSEQAERQKQIAAMEAAAPIAPLPEPEHPHLPASDYTSEASSAPQPDPEPQQPADEARPEPLPIATSGSLNLMPPSTGLPTPRTRYPADPFGGLLASIPAAPENHVNPGKPAPAQTETQAEAQETEITETEAHTGLQETAAHG